MSNTYYTPPAILAYIRAITEPTDDVRVIDPAMPTPLTLPELAPADAIVSNPPHGAT